MTQQNNIDKLKEIITKFYVNELINLQDTTTTSKNDGKSFYAIKTHSSHEIANAEVELIQQTTQALSRAWLTPAEFLSILYIRKSQTIYQLKRANLEKVEQFINDNKIENYQPLSPAKRQLVLHLLATAARLHSVVNTQYYGTAATDEINQILDSVINLIEDIKTNKNLDDLNQRIADIKDSLEANKQNNTWVKRAWDYVLGSTALCLLSGPGIIAAAITAVVMTASLAFMPTFIILFSGIMVGSFAFLGSIFLGEYIASNRDDIRGSLAKATESLEHAITLVIPKKDQGIPVTTTIRSVNTTSLITTQRDAAAATAKATVTATEKTIEPATTRTKRRMTV